MELNETCENRENIDLIMDEPIQLIDKAKFIISHVYYFIRNFYDSNFISLDSSSFKDYLTSFQNKFKPQTISNKFSFELMNKSYNVESQENDSFDINNNSISKINSTNETIFYDILYKKLINIINETNFSKDEKHLIKSFVSLRNCFIFLEYLYLFLQSNPDKIFHYIIKIDISLLLDIPQKTSKRLINSNEFFYLNLIELKNLSQEIDYIPSSFINTIESKFYSRYLDKVTALNIQKIDSFRQNLNKLRSSLVKMKPNSNISQLIDYISTIINDLKSDLDNRTDNNYSVFIEKYIYNVEKNENKKLKEILEEINENESINNNFNYLYLIALNNYGDLTNTDPDDRIIDSSNKNKTDENKKTKNKKISIDEDDKTKDKENMEINSNINDEKRKIKDNIIKIEQLKDNIKNIIDKDICELKMEEIKEENNKFKDYLNRNFLYKSVLNLNKKNIYDIILFLDLLEQTDLISQRNLDNAFKEYKNNFILSVRNINSIDYNYFYDLISDIKFYNEIIAILKSKSISKYLNGYRYYEEVSKKNKKNINIYEVKFVNEKEEFIEYFSNEYKLLMNYLTDSSFFMNLFRLKFLPSGIRAFVNYNLKIIFNSLYYAFNDNIKDSNKKIIFKAAFKIIIVHEIVHILKYLKKDVDFNEMPSTPRKREGGKMLINYLFGIPVIKCITLEEAKKINNITYWDDVEKLQTIFQKENELSETDENERKISDHVDLYFTGEEIEDDDDRKVDNIYNDIGIDID